MVSGYCQSEQGYEYLGRIGQTERNECEVLLRPGPEGWQFVVSLRFRFGKEVEAM